MKIGKRIIDTSDVSWRTQYITEIWISLLRTYPRISAHVTAASLLTVRQALILCAESFKVLLEVIHLGHDRSVEEVVNTAIQEDANAIAMTSYQGGHLEYFKYMYDLLQQRGQYIKIFGGGGGTILPEEIEELHAYGITRLYHPDDGRKMGLQGMINDLVERSDFLVEKHPAK